MGFVKHGDGSVLAEGRNAASHRMTDDERAALAAENDEADRAG